MRQDTALPQAQQRHRTSAREALEAGPGPHSPGFPPVRSLYIHIPFCFHKCHYCDFYSLVDTRDRQEPFTDRLIRELTALSPWAGRAPLETIFVGGGTPSLLRAEHWARLLDALARLFDLSTIRAGRGEFTVECNPETVTPELMDLLRKGGVDRVSIGAQSFQPGHLKTLERWHDPANVARALDLARTAGIPRQSIDLIFAIPGQTPEDWRRDLSAALDLGTEHLSCYSLTYEPGTAMTARLRRGEFTPAEEETELQMHEVALNLLRSRGLDRYEVSNFARPGAECRHNLAYWRQRDWLAAGPSASAHVAGHRWKNFPRLDDYLSHSDDGFAPITDHELPDAVRAVSERMMTGLRLREGLSSPSLLRDAEAARAGSSARLQAAAMRLAGEGTLHIDGPVWSLTDRGILLADAITVDLMAALDGPGR
ncbi:MAG: radical SAM family heme chaperone HemW [Phycisphaerales bacterium]|nr:radical SAM family heme chaperone HemW [Phycisphaerales bacterium]